ncbi:MAG: FAD-binding oxidoreductase [Opitutales bacterium]
MRSGAKQVDYLIVGQGLAGSLLARALLARGRTVLVIDEENPSAASRVAAGLVNPVTGRKLVKTWKADTLLPFARGFYRARETELGKTLYSEKTIWRFFQNATEAKVWEVKRHDPAFAAYTSQLPDETMAGLDLHPQLGGFRVTRGAHVDTRELLRLFRVRLRESGALSEEAFVQADLRVESNRVQWRDVSAKKILFCEGHAVSANPYFSWVPFRHAKGELLTVRGPTFPEEVVLNRGKWLLPVGGDLFRAGATYGWDDLSETPTAAGREAILAGIRAIVPWTPEVIAHEAGVRPIVKDTRPIAGLHPAHPAVGIFNGLGSKGVLWGPYFAEQLVEHLENGGPLDPAVDVRRNL